MTKRINKIISYTIAASVFMSSSGVQALNTDEENMQRETKEIVSTTVSSAGEIAADEIIEDSVSKNGLIVKYRMSPRARTMQVTELDESISEHIDSLEIKDSVEVNGSKIDLIEVETSDIHAVLEDLNTDENIEYAEPNYTIKTYSEPNWNLQWGMENTGQSIQGTVGTAGVDIDIESAWNYTEGSSDVLVAVIDSGIQISHTDLAANIYINPNEVSDREDNDGNGYIDDINGWDFTTYVDPENNGDNTVYDNKVIDGENVDLHGTHVAGIIAAEINDSGIAGVSPDTKLLSVKVIEGLEGTVFHAIKGIEYAESMGAQIANCSWGVGAYVRSLEDCIKSSNMLFVCASGNEGVDVNEYPSYPASYTLDNVISVASVDNTGALSYFSNYGGNVSVAAPGNEIYSTLPSNAYGYESGTSMAAPFVTGVAALLKSKVPEMSASELKERIESTVKKTDNLTAVITSGGIVNAENVLETTIEPVNLTSGKYGAESVVSGGNLYIVGGCSDYSEFSNDILKYDASQSVWVKAGEIPIKSARAGVAENNGIIYIMGGISETGILNKVFAFDTLGGQCTEVASLPDVRYGMGAVSISDSIYIFGGINSKGYTNKSYKYNIASNSWSEISDLPENIGYCESIVLNNRIYIIGGANKNGCLANTYEYKSDSDSFISWQPLNVPRRDATAVVYEGNIMLFGGSASYNKTGTDDIAVPGDDLIHYEALTDEVEKFNQQTNSWESVDNNSYNAVGMSAVNYNDNIYFIGGWNGKINENVEEYFGINIPENLIIKTENQTEMTVSWNKIADADKYQVEINDEVIEVNINQYTRTINADSELSVRVRAVKENVLTGKNQYSMWTESEYYYPNQSMADAQLIELNSVTNGVLYRKDMVRWYKLNTGVYGLLDLSLTNIPEGMSYSMQLCNSAGIPVAYSSSDTSGKIIDDFIVSKYNYYVKVYSDGDVNAENEYTLTARFTATADSAVDNDRIKASILQPSYMEDLPGETVTYSEYDPEDESMKPEITSEAEGEIINAIGSASAGGGEIEVIWDEEDNSDDGNINAASTEKQCSTKDVFDSSIGSVGDSATHSISMDINDYGIRSIRETANLIIEITPDNKQDAFDLKWTGPCANHSNFYWFSVNYNDGTYASYLVCRISPQQFKNGLITYQYSVTLKSKTAGSNGGFVANAYITCGNSSSDEDFKSKMVNDIPLYAQEIGTIHTDEITIKGTLDHKWDRDFYKVYLDGSKITAVLTSPKGEQYYLGIYNLHGTESEYTSSQFMDGWYTEGTGRASASITYSGERWVCIMVNSGSEWDDFSIEEAINAEYTLTIYKRRISASGALEINDEFEHADKKKTEFTDSYLGSLNKLAKEFSFKIDNPIDVDRYRVELEAGDKVSAYMKMDSSYVDDIYQYRLEVHETPQNSKYWCHSYNNPNSPYDKSMTFIAEEDGTYYVAVQSLTGRYSASIGGTLIITKTQKAEFDSYENIKNVSGEETYYSNDFVWTNVIDLFGVRFGIGPEDTNVDSLQTDNLINASIDNELDVDWYKIKVGEETLVPTIRIEEASNYTVSPYQLYLLDANYQIMYVGTKVACAEFQKNGTYYIGICVQDGKYGSVMNSRNYTLSLSDDAVAFDVKTDPEVIKPMEDFCVQYKARLPVGRYTARIKMGWGEGQLYEKTTQAINVTNANNIESFISAPLSVQYSGEHLMIMVEILNSNGEKVCDDYTIIDFVNLGGIIEPQPLIFDQRGEVDGVKHYYIYEDEPEHIRRGDTVNGDTPASLMKLENLEPGVYTLFAYHHKLIDSTVKNGYANDGEQFNADESLYYNAIFYNWGGEGVVRFNKIGCASEGNDYGYYDDGTKWHDYDYARVIGDFLNEDNVIKVKTFNGYKHMNEDLSVSTGVSWWLSDLLEDGDILISDTASMGYVYVMLEFEVISGTVSMATMASSDVDAAYNRNFTKYLGNGVPDMKFDDKPHQVLKGIGNFAQQIETNPVSFVIDDSIPNETPLEFMISNSTLYPGEDIITNKVAADTSPLYPDMRRILPEGSVMDIRLPLEDQTLIFDGYHVPYLGERNIPGNVRFGYYENRVAFESNEAFDVGWMRDLSEVYGSYHYQADSIGDNFNLIIDESTMQQYGITNKYILSIHNAGQVERALLFDSQINGEHTIKILKNGVPNSSEGAYTATRENTITLPAGETTQIEIYSTELAGSLATTINQFIIK